MSCSVTQSKNEQGKKKKLKMYKMFNEDADCVSEKYLKDPLIYFRQFQPPVTKRVTTEPSFDCFSKQLIVSSFSVFFSI